MISFPLYCKSIKQINCFKRQTPNILSSAASKSFVKAAEQAGRQCSQVIRQDVRLEVAAQPEALCQNRGKRLNFVDPHVASSGSSSDPLAKNALVV